MPLDKGVNFSDSKGGVKLVFSPPLSIALKPSLLANRVCVHLRAFDLWGHKVRGTALGCDIYNFNSIC